MTGSRRKGPNESDPSLLNLFFYVVVFRIPKSIINRFYLSKNLKGKTISSPNFALVSLNLSVCAVSS